MRANEAQVADLTSRLHQLQLDKERLESRARLLEQVVSLNLTHEAKLHTNKVVYHDCVMGGGGVRACVCSWMGG